MRLPLRFAQSLLLLVLLCGTALAATFTSTQSGNWTTNATWGGGSNPTASPGNDNITVSVGHAITFTGNISLGANTVLNVFGSLTITGDLSMGNDVTIVVHNGGSITVSGTLTFSNSGITALTINTGGSVTAGNTVINNNNTGTVTGGGTFNGGGCTGTGCGGACGSPCPSGTLPVTWLSFSLDPQADGSVLLRWSTANELNNAYFTLERSRNAADFEPVTVVPGAGTVNEVRSYEASDAKPYEGRSFYRIRQTDFDGTWAASAILEYMGSGTELALFPVPARRGQHVAARFDNTSGRAASLVVVNVQGGAEQAISLPTQGRSTVVYIPTAGLNPGSYQVVLTTGSSQQTAKFVVAE